MGIGVYPEWSKSAFQSLFSQEDPVVHHLIQVPRMYFDLQTPYHWKRGESAYTHKHINWDASFFCVMNSAGAHKFLFGDPSKRGTVGEKLSEAVGRLVSSGGNHLIVGEGCKGRT